MAATPDPPAWSRPGSGGGWHAGAVTRIGLPGAEPATAPPPADPARADRRRLLFFGGTAAGLLITGLVVVLAMTLSGNVDPFWDRPSAPVDVRPPLARMCPGPTTATSPEPVPTAPPAPASPDPAGARTVDEESGISYKAYGAPWEPWRTVWRAGTLEVPYKVGQHFVTEVYSGGTYHASILSAAVPAADNDALALDLECVGRQVAADVRAEYYPQPNRMDLIRDERTGLGGRPAWVTVFRLHFSQPDLQATSELAAVACIDVGTPEAAILYVSIPDTHRQFDWVVDDVLASVRTM
ncbi:MAG TPA: hypothetical protein VFR67_00500 [Pilimelia sp.]|nr:hypothetical protein [Pilimelia sp.]